MPKNVKRWTHVVMVGSPVFKYFKLLNAPENQAFVWEDDIGQNLGGWRFMGTFLIGYQIPVIEDDWGENQKFIKLKHKNFKITGGFLLCIDWLNLTHYFDSQMKDGWGSDFCFVEYGPILNFDLPYNFNTSIIFFWKNEREYTGSTAGNLGFQDRIYKDWYVYFRRIVISFGYYY